MLHGMSMLFSSELLSHASALLDDLKQRDFTIATAESCTSGLLMGLLTEISGASAVVERGFITYSNAAKSEMLGVDPELIVSVGAVSEDVARAMAEGVLDAAPVDLALSVTGIAGPDGGSAEKPVGLVYLGAAMRGSAPVVRECRFGNIGRTEIRLASLREAVALARGAMSSAPPV